MYTSKNFSGFAVEYHNGVHLAKAQSMARITIRHDDRLLDKYYKTLRDLRERQHARTEGETRRAFATLLTEIAKKQKWTLVEEVGITLTDPVRRIRVDGALRDQMRLARAYFGKQKTPKTILTLKSKRK